MPQFTIQEVNVEKVTKGKNSYNVATVTYTTDRGDNKSKKVMSFSNPSVFATVQAAKSGDRVEVTYTPGDEYYNWATIKVINGDEPATVQAAAKAAPTAGKVLGSTYETAEERKIKQLYIVKQSSIGHALTFWFGTTPQDQHDVITVDSVLGTAQKFVDFVYGTKDLASMDSDLSDLSEA